MNIETSNLLPSLPTDSKIKTLVLDIDETLIHSSFKKSANTKFSFFIEKHQKSYEIFVSIRPGAYEFLKEMSKYYEIVTFTASQQTYCDNILNFLDPNQSLIKHRLYRQHCIIYQGVLVKDLRRIGRNLSNIIIIDNNPDSYLFSQENGYEISNFINNQNDKELYNLIPFLIQMKDLADVREVELWKIKFDDLQKCSAETTSVNCCGSENILEDDDDSSKENQMTLLQENYTSVINQLIIDNSEKIIKNDFSPPQRDKPKLVKIKKKNSLIETPEGVRRRSSLCLNSMSEKQVKQLQNLNQFQKQTQNNNQQSIFDNREEFKMCENSKEQVKQQQHSKSN